jgi:hypothetical protein
MAAHSPLDVDPSSNIEEEARRAARKRAIERLAEELQNPDQLVKVCIYPFAFTSSLQRVIRAYEARRKSLTPLSALLCRLGRANQVQTLQQEDIFGNSAEELGELSTKGGKRRN